MFSKAHTGYENSTFLQSFHKKGYKIIARKITDISNATKSNTICSGAPSRKISENALFDNFTSNMSCGIIIGKPSMAIRDACCIALEAIAASIVKTRLNPIAPIRLIPINPK